MKKICLRLLFTLLAGLLIYTGLPSGTVWSATSSTKSPTAELFITSWCPYCNQAKAYLERRGVDYRVYDIEKDPVAAKRKKELDPGRGVPFAIINGIKISGWSQSLYETALDK